MARQPKAPVVLTPAEKKEAKTNLKAALKAVNDEHAKFVSDHKAAEKAHAAIEKAAGKQIAESLKTVEGLKKKLDKATAAAEQGRAKIAAQLAALDPAPASTPETATA